MKTGYRITNAHASEKQKYELWLKEAEIILQESRELIKKSRDSHFISAQSSEYAKPLFSLIWSSLLPSFSVLLEQNDDSKIIKVCLEGYSLCVYLAGRYKLEDERDTFVISLYNFTGLKKGFK